MFKRILGFIASRLKKSSKNYLLVSFCLFLVTFTISLLAQTEENALIEAIRRNDQKAVTQLLEKGEDVNVKTERGTPALIYAAELGCKEIIELLLLKGADVTAKDSDGSTVLMAAANARKEIVEFLFLKGAEINTQDERGFSPLMYVALNGCKEVAEFLISKGANVNVKSKNGETALMFVARRGAKEITELLIINGADLNVQDYRGDTALMDAAKGNQKEIVELLLSKGADVNITDNDGRTVSMQLEKKENYNKDIIDLLHSQEDQKFVSTAKRTTEDRNVLVKEIPGSKIADNELMAYKIAADNLITIDNKLTVQYKLKTLSGEVVLLEIDYDGDLPTPDIVTGRCFLAKPKEMKEGLNEYFLIPSEGQKIKITFVYKNGELTNTEIGTPMDLTGYSEDNPYSLTVVSNSGYEIRFNFYEEDGSKGIKIVPKINPWSTVEPISVVGQGPYSGDKYFPTPDEFLYLQNKYFPSAVLENEEEKTIKPLSNLFRIIQDGKYGYIDKTGSMVVNPRFDEAKLLFFEGLAAVKVGEKWGYINENGEFIIQPQFDEAENFSDGVAVVEVDKGTGVIDQKGMFVIGPNPEYFFPFREFQEGFIFDSRQECFFDKKGGKAFSGKYAESLPFSEGMAAVWAGVGEKWGYINRKGEMVIESQFDEARSFSDGLALVRINDNLSYINKKGKVVIQLNYKFDSSGPSSLEEIYMLLNFDFHEGLAWMFAINGGFGYINKMGKFVKLRALSEKATPVFSEGLAGVPLSEEYGGWGYINKEGVVVIQPKFASVGDFHNGVALVIDSNDLKQGYIDKTGKYIWKSKE